MFDLVPIHRLAHIKIDSETRSPLRGVYEVLQRSNTPYRNNGREEDKEPKDIDIPQSSEAVESNEDKRKSECHSTKDL
jgi:hypothetical protein